MTPGDPARETVDVICRRCGNDTEDGNTAKNRRPPLFTRGHCRRGMENPGGRCQGHDATAVVGQRPLTPCQSSCCAVVAASAGRHKGEKQGTVDGARCIASGIWTRQTRLDCRAGGCTRVGRGRMAHEWHPPPYWWTCIPDVDVCGTWNTCGKGRAVVPAWTAPPVRWASCPCHRTACIRIPLAR